MARSFHENYLDTIRKGKKDPTKIGTEWDDLEEVYKESNRQAADHLPIKLRAIGINFNPFKPETYPNLNFTINDDQIEFLSKMEHIRWCAERWIDRWEYVKENPDRTKKQSAALTDWKNLFQEDKDKDINQVKAIPGILIKHKKQIQLLNAKKIFVPFIHLKFFLIDNYKRLRN